MAKIIEIPLSGGYVTLVDELDFDKVKRYNWYLSSGRHTKYALGWIAETKKQAGLHRFIMGVTDPKIFVDHKDGNGLNNTRENLRLCTPAQNAANKISKKNTASKYLGVSFITRKNRWRAMICKNNKFKYLGTFINEKDAALAYNKAAIEIHGEFARPNIICD